MCKKHNPATNTAIGGEPSKCMEEAPPDELIAAVVAETICPHFDRLLGLIRVGRGQKWRRIVV